jgi:hypothetical protein
LLPRKQMQSKHCTWATQDECFFSHHSYLSPKVERMLARHPCHLPAPAPLRWAGALR